MSIPELSFGVGCFHFGVKKAAPFKFLGSEYLEKLKTALASIPSINNIDIGGEGISKWAFDVAKNIPSIRDSTNYFPARLFITISFEVFIPFRIQEEILRKESRTLTERFHVKCDYGHSSPIAIISLLNPSGKPRPGDGVIVVRKFLEKEINKPSQDYINFEILGPSPFHANFYLEPAEGNVGEGEEEWRYRVDDRRKIRGYDEIRFFYNKSHFENAKKAMGEIYWDISDEIALFYSVVNQQDIRVHEWVETNKVLEKLITVQNMTGARGLVGRFFGCGGLISKALTDLAVFLARGLQLTEGNNKKFEDVYRYRKQPAIQSFVEKEIKHPYYFPAREYSDLVSFYERRRSKTLEILIVLVSTVLGGSIGALLTLLLTK